MNRADRYRMSTGRRSSSGRGQPPCSNHSVSLLARLPNLAYDLDKLPRPLELDPSPAEKLEVRR